MSTCSTFCQCGPCCWLGGLRCPAALLNKLVAGAAGGRPQCGEGGYRNLQDLCPGLGCLLCPAAAHGGSGCGGALLLRPPELVALCLEQCQCCSGSGLAHTHICMDKWESTGPSLPPSPYPSPTLPLGICLSVGIPYLNSLCMLKVSDKVLNDVTAVSAAVQQHAEPGCNVGP